MKQSCMVAHLDTSRINSYTRSVSTLGSVLSTDPRIKSQIPVNMAIDDLFFISTAAEQLGMHPQTLRKYERLGLIRPSRTIGSMRLYAREELERLRLIKQLVDAHGINLAGVQRLLAMAEVMQRIQPLLDESALSTGNGRRQLLHEIKHLNELLGL